MHTYEPIGFIESCFIQKFGTPRQPHLVPSSWARLKIRADLYPVPALLGLEKFSHVWVIFEFHKNTNKKFNPKVKPPRLNGDNIGVFATRSPHRPNPIGLSCLKLERIDEDTLYFSGVDLIDGTPVLDIKPYLPSDSVTDAKFGWIENVKEPKLQVEFSDEALEDLKKYRDRNLKTMIAQIIGEDPRNPMDKKPSRHNKKLGFFLGNTNVIFSVNSFKVATVHRVEPQPVSD